MKRIITIHFYLFITLNLYSQESTYKFIGVGDMMLGTNYPSDSYIPPKGTRLLKNVEEILASIEREGDTAVRVLSEKFDKYSPPAFRLSASAIEDLMAQVSDRDMEDLKFAQQLL